MFKGTITALMTPFCADGVDISALERLIDRQLEAGVNALVVLGTTGEPATMTAAEKQSVIRCAVARCKGEIPVIVGAGSNSTVGAIDNCAMARRLGADGALIVTPYYNKCTQRGLIEHYGAIAATTDLPIICYNVPSRTGVNMLPSTCAELAKLPNVVGFKEASGNVEQIEECIRLVGDKVYSGDDALTVPLMAMGASGVISVVSNILPRCTVRMTDAALRGDIAEARARQLKLLPLIKALFCEVNPIPVKKAAEHMGLCSGAVRLPLTPLSRENAEKLREILDEYEDA